MDVGEAHVASAEAEREAFVVKAEEVENGGVEIVDVDRVFDGAHAHFIRGAIGDSAANTAAGEEDGVAADMMVAAVGAGRVGSAAHFAGPEDEGFVEEAAGFQVGDEGGDGLVGDAGVFLVAFAEFAVLVPGGVVAVGERAGDLDEANAGLDEAAGAKALEGVEFVEVVRAIDAVEAEGGGGFAGHIAKRGDEGLHAGGGLVIADGGFDGGVGIRAGGVVLVAEEIEFGALNREGIGGGDVVHGPALGANGGGLMGGREEGAGEILGTAVGDPIVVEEDVAGEVFVFGAEAVGDPRADAGRGADAAAGVEEEILGSVEWSLTDHRADDTEVVGDAGDVGKQVADPESRLAALPEVPRVFEPFAAGADALGEFVVPPLRGLAVAPGQFRFGVKRVHVGNAAVHEEEDDVFGARGEMGLGAAFIRGGGLAGESGAGEPAEAETGLLEKAAAISGHG